MTIVRSLLKQLSIRLFLLGDRLGLHVLPKHFYSPIPDYRWLRERRDLWTRRAPLTGIRWDLDDQVRWLAELCTPYYPEVRGLRIYREIAGAGIGAGYGPIESQVLHCFMRAQRPPRVIEIGSGVSTACMLRAARLNQEEGLGESRVTCIEPYPRKDFDQLAGITLIREMCQRVPASLFDELRDRDLLFIDSSHAVKTGSDTVRIYAELIPRLAAGVFIHIHDITLPYLYPPDALANPWGWQETALLLTLLTHNPRLSVLACESALHHDRPAALARILPDYQPRTQRDGLDGPGASQTGKHFPASIWLRTR